MANAIKHNVTPTPKVVLNSSRRGFIGLALSISTTNPSEVLSNLE
jgi:hypothetical protein